MKRLLLLLLLAATPAIGQVFTDTVVNRLGQPVAGASVAFFNITPNTTACTANLATLYTSYSLATACTGFNGCSNPTQSDSFGNVSVNAAPGWYCETITGYQVTTTTRLIQVSTATGGGGGGTPGGATTQMQYNNAGAFGGTVNFAYNNSTGELDFSQLADGNNGFVFTRATDSGPTGRILTGLYANGSTIAWSIDAVGNITANNITGNNINAQTLLDGPYLALTIHTVAGLSGTPGYIALVSDGLTSTDCTIGGGHFVVPCLNTGSWGPLASGTSTSPGGSSGAVQFNSSGTFGGASTFAYTPAGGLIVKQSANTNPVLVLQRAIDVLPSGNDITGLTAAGSQIWAIDVSGNYSGVSSTMTGTAKGAYIGFTIHTVAGLSGAAVDSLAIVTDGLTSADCTVGGGSTVALCFNNGSGWGPIPSAVSVAGSNTQVQYNNSGTLGASSAFTFNNGTSTLNATNITGAFNGTVGAGTPNTVAATTVTASSAGTFGTGQAAHGMVATEGQQPNGSNGLAACAAGLDIIWGDATNHAMYGCNDGGAPFAIGSGGGGSPAFSSISGGTNTGAAMAVGTGASLGTSGTGTIQATNALAAGIAFANPASGTTTVKSGATTSSPTIIYPLNSGTLALTQVQQACGSLVNILPCRLVDNTGNTGTISATTLVTPGAESQVEVCGDMWMTTAGTAGVTWQLQMAYTNNGIGNTRTVTSLSETSTGDSGNCTSINSDASQPIKYQVVVIGSPTGTYTVKLTLKWNQ